MVSVTYNNIHKFLCKSDMQELERALIDSHTKFYGDTIADLVRSRASDWIHDLFDWESSPQGHEYWLDTYQYLLEKEEKEFW